MQRYKNLGGDSGVTSYQIEEEFILVKFSSGDVYSYSYASAGKANIENMKTLARSGRGLNAYIMKKVKDKFDK